MGRTITQEAGDESMKKELDDSSEISNLKMEMISIKTQIKMLFLSGAVFWGFAQAVVWYKLEDIDNTGEIAVKNQQELYLMQYRLQRQDALNETIVDQIAENKKEIEKKFYLLEDKIR